MKEIKNTKNRWKWCWLFLGQFPLCVSVSPSAKEYVIGSACFSLLFCPSFAFFSPSFFLPWNSPLFEFQLWFWPFFQMEFVIYCMRRLMRQGWRHTRLAQGWALRRQPKNKGSAFSSLPFCSGAYCVISKSRKGRILWLSLFVWFQKPKKFLHLYSWLGCNMFILLQIDVNLLQWLAFLQCSRSENSARAVIILLFEWKALGKFCIYLHLSTICTVQIKCFNSLFYWASYLVISPLYFTSAIMGLKVLAGITLIPSVASIHHYQHLCWISQYSTLLKDCRWKKALCWVSLCPSCSVICTFGVFRFPRAGGQNARFALKVLRFYLPLEDGIVEEDEEEENDGNVNVDLNVDVLTGSLELLFPWAEYLIEANWTPDGAL